MRWASRDGGSPQFLVVLVHASLEFGHRWPYRFLDAGLGLRYGGHRAGEVAARWFASFGREPYDRQEWLVITLEEISLRLSIVVVSRMP